MSLSKHIPGEVLSHIFSYTMEFPSRWKFNHETAQFDDLRTWFRVRRNRHTCKLWDLELVCKQWHSVIRNDASLWSRVTFYVDEKTAEDQSGKARARLVKHLERSGQYALSLSLMWSPIFFTTEDVFPAYFTEALKPHAHRIQYLDLAASVHHIATGFDPLEGMFDNLTSLDFLHLHRMSREWYSNISAFHKAPKLTRVGLEDVLYPTRCMHLPWENVQKLYLGHNTYPTSWPEEELPEVPDLCDTGAVLEASTQLRRLDIVLGTTFGAYVRNMISFPYLERLGITVSEESAQDFVLCSLLDHLEFPALKVLDIQADDTVISGKPVASDAAFTSVVDAVERSNCKLQEIYFPDGIVLQEDLERLIEVVAPTIKVFALWDICTADAPLTLEPLVDAIRAGLPELENLSLSGYLLYDGQAVVDAITSHKDGNRISELELYAAPSTGFRRQDIEKEWDIVERGLRGCVISTTGGILNVQEDNYQLERDT